MTNVEQAASGREEVPDLDLLYAFDVPAIAEENEERLTILANADVSRGKYAAAAVHAALYHYGIDHGAVIVLGARAGQIEERCELVIHDAGRTEVKPGTATAGIAREGTTE